MRASITMSVTSSTCSFSTAHPIGVRIAGSIGASSDTNVPLSATTISPTNVATNCCVRPSWHASPTSPTPLTLTRTKPEPAIFGA